MEEGDFDLVVRVEINGKQHRRGKEWVLAYGGGTIAARVESAGDFAYLVERAL